MDPSHITDGSKNPMSNRVISFKASSIGFGGTRLFFCLPSRMHIYFSVGPLECIFMALLTL